MKKIKYLLFIILITFIGTLRVNAFSVTGATTTTVGSSIAVTIEASGLTGRFDVTTTNGSVLSGGKSIWLENNSTTLYFTAQSVGTANVVVTATNVSDENGNDFIGKRILYVTVKEKSSSSNNNKPSVDVNKKYSSNNYLKSLSIEGYELEPVFNKETLEYNVTLKVDTTSINVLAEKEDNTAFIKGIGEVPVNDGPNTIIVTVVAENGNERQYKINATVEEPKPIEVTVNNKRYTIARKNKLENVPTSFEEKLINIEGQNVNAYYNEIAKITIVSLKDEKGNISLFSYNNGKYTPFNEAKGAGVNLSILDNNIKQAPSGFIKTTFKYNDVTLNGYKLKGTKNDDYYLVYAQSLETGDKAFYLYDKKEGTFQRYYEELSNVKDMIIKYLFYIASALLGLFIIIILIKIINKLFTSKERKIKKYQKKIDKLNKEINSNDNDDSDNYDIDDVDERPVIKKVEEDEYVVPKKTRKQKIKEIEEAKKKLDKTKPSFRRVSLEDDD